MATQNAASRSSARGKSEKQASKPSPPSRTSKAQGAQQAFGGTREPNEHYALISVLYHALQGAETCAQYIRDAQTAKDEELVQFFSEVQEDEEDRAERAKELLVARLAGEADVQDDEEEGEDEEDEDDED
jgi:hypothetical protein